MADIRTRMAPSPTGLFHIGSARTALFNYLFAKRYGGKFVLRIEDTDTERSRKEFEDDIFRSLEWLGIKPDEGPMSGAHGPYRQSERVDIYESYLKKLLDDGRAYYCFHSPEELEAEKQALEAEKKQPIHTCSYRDTPVSDAPRLKTNHPSWVIRFKTPYDRTIIFKDLVRGEVQFKSELLGDFSIAKNLREPLYNFAVVVDDFLMEISHVLRGEEHLSNTPRQVLLAEAMGFEQVPEYGHLSLILAPDRAKLSKRHGAVAVTEYKRQGYLPEALVNFVAFLGWNPGDEREIFSLRDLEGEFSIEKVQKAGAIFNQDKLDWFNAHYIKQKSVDELVELCMPYVHAGITNQKVRSGVSDAEFLKKIVALEQPRLAKLSDIVVQTRFFFELPSYETSLLSWKDAPKEKTIEALEASKKLLSNVNELPGINALQDVFYAEAEKFGGKGPLLWPLRAALSGQAKSPGPFEIIEVLGIEESLKRIETALQNLNR